MRPGSLAVVAAAAVLAVGGLYLLREARRTTAQGPINAHAAPRPTPAVPPPSSVGVLEDPPLPPPPPRPRRPPPPPAPVPVFTPAPVEAPPPPPPPPALATVITASGLQYQDQRIGTGPEPRPGQMVVVHYTGWLDAAGGNGAQFDGSRDRGEPIELPFGKGAIIPGWEEGLATMRVGGLRTLVLPAALGYGERGVGDKIPPGAVLRFEIELLDTRDPAAPTPTPAPTWSP